MNLIAKYLPKRFGEFQMDPKVIQFLNRLIATDSISVLLISRTGCGKTSLINAIVNTYLGGHPKASSNVLVVNSSKEQGVTFYRNQVRTFCQSLSTVPGKKRVVILDDIDAISEQAQQLFRTCMDQYGRSVHFIASCTDQRKVIECLQSRLVGVKIPSLGPRALEKIATRVINGEGLSVDKDALNHIISVSQGSARSVISYIEKASLIGGEMTLESAEELCTDISWKEFEMFISHVAWGNIRAATRILYDIHDQGFSVMDILDNFFCFLKQSDRVAQSDVYLLLPVVCKYLMRLHDVYSHTTELAFFTRSVTEALRTGSAPGLPLTL